MSQTRFESSSPLLQPKALPLNHLLTWWYKLLSQNIQEIWANMLLKFNTFELI
jgi:hypothetical protein